MKYFSSLLILLVLVACSSKQTEIKTVQRAAKQEWKDQYFYAELQILAETQDSEGCEDRQKITERDEKNFRFKLTEEKQVEVLRDDWAPIFYVLNVSIKSIGFDQTSYRFSSIDGFIPKFVPYDLNIRRVPGGGGDLEIQFFDQTVRVDLEQTPVFSFSAKENRDGCEITHNVNLFAENAGDYLISKD